MSRMDAPNFILYNLPREANLVENNKLVSVGYDNMRDTLSQFGKVKVLSINNGIVHAKFHKPQDAKKAHNTINRMMIGKHIVRTQVF